MERAALDGLSARMLVVMGATLGGPVGLSLGQPTITNLGTLAGGDRAEALGISADGSTVGGLSNNAAGTLFGVRWSRASGIQNLGILPGDISSEANGVSGDGAVVVGRSNGPTNSARAFGWTATLGIQPLGTLPGWGRSIANAANRDGSVIVGYAGTEDGYRAVRWRTLGGIQDLGTLAGSIDSIAYGVSGDGAVVVGTVGFPTYERAFRWTAATGMRDLGTLPGGSSSNATAVSGDGSTVVGFSVDASGRIAHGFRWTVPGGMEDLGVPEGASSASIDAVNGDGSVGVGWSWGSEGVQRPILWTRALGMVDLSAFLVSQGVVLAGWDLHRASGISGDGLSMVGHGEVGGLSQSWLVEIPCPFAFGPRSVQTVCPANTAVLRVTAAGTGPFGYQWRKDGVALTDSARVSGSRSDTLRIAGVLRTDQGGYDCVVTSGCGGVISDGSMLLVGAGDFNGDGGIDGTDVEAFFAAWEGGDAVADVNGDGGVDGTDVGVFFQAWEAGC